jgi:hypothetical protein
MKYGKIDPAQFEIKSYDKDTSAEALILGDYGESHIIYDQNDGFVVEYSRHFRAKIFKKSAYRLANNYIILFRNGNGQDRVSSLKGSVYNIENGKVVESEMDKSMVSDEVIDSRHSQKKFTLPNVKEGSIIEFYYLVRSDFWWMPDWQMQYDIPALWSEYRVSYPEYFYFKKLQKGYLNFDVNEETTKPVSFTITVKTQAEGISVEASTDRYDIKYNDQVFRWVKNDVPAFHEEPFMNAVVNYQSAIELELASYKPPFGMVKNYSATWEGINRDLLDDENFGLQLKWGGFLKDNVILIKSNNITSLKQMIAAYDFVRSNMKWDNRNRLIVNQSLKSSFEKRAGSSADINLLLVVLLKELGLDADPVILSTRENGIIHPAQAMLNQFNYVIASVTIDGKTYLLDATEKQGAYNLLPSRCINGQGRIISETKSDWIDLNPTQRYEFTNVLQVSMDKDGVITGNFQRMFGNYAALTKRNEIKNSKDNDDYVRNLENKNKGLTVKKYELIDVDSLTKAYKENLEVEIADQAQITGNIISLVPLLYDQWDSNPFKLEQRQFPVDFAYPRIYKDIINLSIPEGYTVDEKPADLVVALPDGKTKFTYRLKVTGNTLQIMSTLDIGKNLYVGEEYANLKQFFSTVVSKQAEKIVIKKI